MLNRFITARKRIQAAVAQVYTYVSNPNKERRMLNDFGGRKAGRLRRFKKTQKETTQNKKEKTS